MIVSNISEKMLGYLMSINKAHLMMLAEEKIISRQDTQTISRALHQVNWRSLPRSPQTGFYSLSYLPIEKLLIQEVGDIASNLHLARSNNDLGVTVSKMALRERILAVISAATALESQLMDCAEEQIQTVMVGYTHTQPGQPTTMGHYLMAVADMFGRDIKRYQSAYASCNRCSMGAAAITTSGFPISRPRVAELLAFDGLAENAYDAIGGADHIGELSTTIQLSCINMSRVVTDFLLWCTEEFHVLTLSDEHSGGSSIMPQKRNPSMFEDLRAAISTCYGLSGSVLFAMHNTPYGDIGDIKAIPASDIWRCLDRIEQIYDDLTSVLKAMSIDQTALYQRVVNSFCTVTELADNLVRFERLTFRTAHHIVNTMVKKARLKQLAVTEVTLDLLQEAAQEVIGRAVDFSQEMLLDSLDPVKFVDKRSRLGGPNAFEVMRMINDRRKNLHTWMSWCTLQQDKWQAARENLDYTIEQWSRQAGVIL